MMKCECAKELTQNVFTCSKSLMKSTMHTPAQKVKSVGNRTTVVLLCHLLTSNIFYTSFCFHW